MSLRDFFDKALGISNSEFTWFRPGGGSFTVKMSSSNYSRNKEGPEEITMVGKEFVISMSEVSKTTFNKPKKGDIFISATDGENMVEFCIAMKGLNGEVMGFRIRTS